MQVALGQLLEPGAAGSQEFLQARQVAGGRQGGRGWLQLRKAGAAMQECRYRSATFSDSDPEQPSEAATYRSGPHAPCRHPAISARHSRLAPATPAAPAATPAAAPAATMLRRLLRLR